MRKTKEQKTILSGLTSRRGLLVSLLLALVLFVCTGTVSLFEERRAFAAASATSYFMVDSATTTRTFTEGNGVNIDGKGTGDTDRYKRYSGVINGKFNTADETNIEFYFPADAGATNAINLTNYAFTFKVEDVSGMGAYFLVKYYYASRGSAGGRVAVVYVDEEGNETFVSTSANGSQIASSADELETLNTACLPYLRGGSSTVGYVNFDWDDNGVLSVSAPLYSYVPTTNQNPYATAKKTAVAKFGEGVYGLPKIEFANGYKISFWSNGYHSVTFKSVAGTSLTTVPEATPAWHTAGQYVTNIVLDGEIEKVYPLNTSITFPTAKFYTGNGETDEASIILTPPSGPKKTITDSVKLTTAGTYKITYVDDYSDDVDNVGNNKTYTFTVKEGVFTNMSSLIEVQGGTLTQSAIDRYAGLQVTADAGYTGAIKGVFGSNENTKVEFVLPNTKGVNSGTGAQNLNLVFKIEDALDATKYFEIEYYYSTVYNRRTNAIVRYVDENGTTQYRYSANGQAKTPAIYTEKNAEAKNDAITVLPEANNESANGYFSLVWTGDVLSVKAPTVYAGALQANWVTDTTLAKFDGTSAVNASTSEYGLPKISFPNGYKISFSSATKQSIMFNRISGTDLGKEFAETTPAWHQAFSDVVFIEPNETIWEKYPANVAVNIPSATYDYHGAISEVSKIELKKDGGAYEVIAAGERTLAAGTYTLRYTAREGVVSGGNVKEYTFIVQEAEEFSVYIYGGGTSSVRYPVNYNVEILSAQYSFVSDKLVPVSKIELKKGDGSYQFIEAGKRTFSEAGVYTLRYTAIEGGVYAGNVKELTFEIVEEDAFAVSFIGGGTQFNAYPVNYAFEILDAKYAFVSGDAFSVAKIEVKKADGEFKEIFPGFTRFSEVGTYTLRYTAVNGGAYIDNFKDFTFEIQEQAEFSLDIAVNGEYEASYPAYYTFTVYDASYTLLTDDVLKAEKIEVSRNGGAFRSISAGEISFDVLGEYELRYTAVANGEYQGNEKIIRFKITADSFLSRNELKNLFVGEGLSVKEHEVSLYGGEQKQGLLVGANAENTSGQYAGAIKGTFATGQDMTVQMLFPDTGVATSNFGITFRVEDVNNSANYFDIVYYYLPADASTRCKTRIAVVYNDAFRATNYTKTGGIVNIWTSKEKVESTEKPNGAVPDAKYNGKEGYFTIAWEGDVLVVKAPALDATSFNYGSSWDAVIAKFDGTSAVSDSEKTFGLPKISFANGYKISFISTSMQPIMFTNISGLNLREDVRQDKLTATSMTLHQNSITYQATTKEVDVKSLSGIGATVNYQASFGAYSFLGSMMTYPDISPIDFKVAGTYELTYSFPGATSLRQTLTIIDDAPVLSFTQGIYAQETYCMGGENQSSLTISKTDIGHITDAIDGIIDANTVSVYIKGPADSDYREYAFGEFQPLSTGIHLIKYTVKDSNNVEGYLIREITVVDGSIPVIELESELPESALLKQTITLPVGSAASNGKEIDLTRSVYCNDEVINVTNNQLTFDRVGTYEITYFAIDEFGKESLLRFTFVIEEDDDSPVITIEEMPLRVLIGNKVNIANYIAMDAVDGEVDVVVKVLFGTKEVAVSNGAFTASALGTYSIVLSANDMAGNVAEKVVAVTAVATFAEEGDGTEIVGGNAEGGCSGSIVSGSGALFALAFVVFVKRRKNNKE